MITVMGATGRTGGEIVRLLLGRGEAVRALGRSDARLEQLRNDGAETMAGDAADAGFLTQAFHGADCVYTLLPYDPTRPDYHATQRAQGEAIARALRTAEVPAAVMLSSVGADLPAGTGFIASLHEQEQRLRALPDTHVLALRCAWFLENAAESMGMVRAMGILADALAPDLPVPMIATRDIAAAAATALVARDWSGFTVRELLGQRDLTMTEVAAVIGAQIGQPDLPYVQVDDDELIGALVAAGWARSSAGAHVELCRALNDGTIVSREGRTPDNTTPTRFEDVVVDLARDDQAVILA